jgi:hypothetical protein
MLRFIVRDASGAFRRARRVRAEDERISAEIDMS